MKLERDRLRRLERTGMKLHGRTILITGGSAGIGLAFARTFLDLDNQVIVTGRRLAMLDASVFHHRLYIIELAKEHFA